MARILIMGATRGIGRATVEQALNRDHRVRAFARSAGDLDGSDDRLEPYPGDALDAQQVEQALEGVDVVIQTLGIKEGPCMVVGPVTLFSEATRRLVPAMERQGVKRLITVTGFGAGNSRGHLPLFVRVPFELVLGRAYDDKSRQEQIIKDSGLDWTIARPAKLTNEPGTGSCQVLRYPEDWRYGTISREDVASFLLDQVEDSSLVHQAPVLIS